MMGEQLAHLSVHISCYCAGATEGDALVEGASDSVEAAPRLPIRSANVDRVRGIGPGTVDPGRCIGEDEVVWLDDARCRDTTARRSRRSPGRDGEYGRHAPTGLAEHRGGGQPSELGFADTWCGLVLDSLLDDICEQTGPSDRIEAWTGLGAPGRGHRHIACDWRPSTLLKPVCDLAR
jgi:hypothetical protein